MKKVDDFKKKKCWHKDMSRLFVIFDDADVEIEMLVGLIYSQLTMTKG